MSSTLNEQQRAMMCTASSQSSPCPQPGMYGFCDTQGHFHGFEGSDGKKLVMAMKALEEKILGKMERSLNDMSKQIGQIATEQTYLRTKVDTLSQEAFESRSDLLQHIDELSREAFESRSDLVERADQMSREALEARVDCLSALEELEQRIKAASSDVDTFQAQLSSEMHADQEQEHEQDCREFELELIEQQQTKINTIVAKMEDKVKVVNLIAALHFVNEHCMDKETADEEDEEQSSMPEEPPIEHGEKTLPTACELDLSSTSTPQEPLNSDMWSQAAAIGHLDFQYSSKMDAKGGVGFAGFAGIDGASTLFSYSRKSVAVDQAASSFSIHRPRPISRMTSSQSMPLLAPLF